MPRAPILRRPQRRQQLSSPSRKLQNKLNSGSPRLHLARQLADKAIGKRVDDSDDSDQLVTKGAGGRRGRHVPVQEIYASGAVAGSDKPGSHPTRAQRKQAMARASQSPRVPESKSRRAQTGVLEATQSAQPTPSRDGSILDGIQLRKRQPSILRPAQLDSSTLDPSNDSFTLPDDESTPLQTQKTRPAATTPNAANQSIPTSSPRKRKLGSVEGSKPVSNASPVVSPNPAASKATPTPGPSLPPQSIAAIHASGQKHRREPLDREDEDVMALPLSSPSAPSSPARRSSSATKPSQQPHFPTTADLQAFMPTKRRKTARHAKRAEFDIPSDSHSDPAGEADDSFLPSKRKGKRQKANTTATRTKAKAKASTTSKARTKANTSKPLQPVRTARNTSTKSPTPASFLGRSRPDSPTGVGRRSGGSPLKAITISLVDSTGKENEPDVLVARSDGEGAGPPAMPKVKEKPQISKWDEIDAWDMDFEDVSVADGSSDVNAR